MLVDDNGISCFTDDIGNSSWTDDVGQLLACIEPSSEIRGAGSINVFIHSNSMVIKKGRR